jgi:hypothetical protein
MLNITKRHNKLECLYAESFFQAGRSLRVQGWEPTLVEQPGLIALLEDTRLDWKTRHGKHSSLACANFNDEEKRLHQGSIS